MEQQMIEFLQALITQVNDLTVLAWAVPLIVIVVALVKRIPFMSRFSGGALQLAVQVIVWALYAYFDKGGNGAAFKDWISAITVILQTLLPLVGGLFGASWLYGKAAEQGVPVIGFKRS